MSTNETPVTETITETATLSPAPRSRRAPRTETATVEIVAMTDPEPPAVEIVAVAPTLAFPDPLTYAANLATEMDALRAEWSAKGTALHASQEADRVALKVRHEAERAALKGAERAAFDAVNAKHKSFSDFLASMSALLSAKPAPRTLPTGEKRSGGPGRPRQPTPPAVVDLADKVHAHLLSRGGPGLSSQQIRETMGVSASIDAGDMYAALLFLRENGRLSTAGERRGAIYSALVSPVPAPV